jgi:DNA-binding MarR family transcriptional regulator
VQADAAHRAITNLQRLAEVFTERRRQLAATAALTETQWRVLEEVSGEDFLPSMFARRRAITAAAVSRTLRQLLDQGLVQSAIGASDGRQRRYHLTTKGQRALQKVHDAREQAVRDVWSDLPTEELEAFGRFSEQLAQRLEKYAAKAQG